MNDTSLYQLPAALTKEHKLTGLKQYKCFTLPLSHWTQIGLSAAQSSFWRLSKRLHSLSFPASRGCRIPWLAALFPFQIQSWHYPDLCFHCHISSLTLLSPSFHYKGLCGYTGPICIIRKNLPFPRLLLHPQGPFCHVRNIFTGYRE